MRLFVLNLGILIFSTTLFSQTSLSYVLYEDWGNFSWNNSARYSYEYDSLGNKTVELNEIWSMSNPGWINKDRYLSGYDSLGNEVELIWQNWSSSQQAWQDDRRFTKIFSSNGRLIERTIESMVNGSWSAYSRSYYTYDPNGLLIKIIGEYWDPGLNSWVNSGQDSIVNNLNGLPVERIYRTWNSSTGSWKNSYRILHSYNTMGLESSSTMQSWSNGLWNNLTKEDRTYTSTGVLTLWEYFNWQATIGSWSEFRKKDYVINSQGLVQSFIQKNFVAGSWESTYRGTYFYQAMNIDQLAVGLMVEVYPNPSAEKITIRFEKPGLGDVIIFNIQGQKVGQIKINGSVTEIGINSLPPGQYCLKYSSGTESGITTFLKR